MKKILVFFAVWTLGYLNAHSAPLPRPDVEKLPNGLTIAWFVGENLPILDLAILIQSGFRDDPKGKSGTSELMASLLTRGSRGKSAAEMAWAVDQLGATQYVTTDDDTITLGMHGLSEDAETLLGQLADITLAPNFEESEITKQSARLLDRWSHLVDHSEGLATVGIHRVVSSGTPYSRGGIVGVDEFKKLKKKDLQEFYRRAFTPKNAVLMVVGRVDREKLKKKILTLFSSWKGEASTHSDVRVKHVQFIPGKNQIGLLIDRADQSQAQVKMGFLGPLIRDKDHYALAVANAVLGEYFQSRLNSLIRDQLGLTYGIESRVSYNKDAGFFFIATSCRNEVVGDLLFHTKKVMSEFVSKGITEDELRSAKEYLTGAFPIRMGTLGAVASRWLSGFVHGFEHDYLNEYIPKISAVKLTEVNQAIRKHLGKKLSIVIAGESKEIQKSLKKRGLANFKQVKAKDLL